jgi:hypothetical protein
VILLVESGQGPFDKRRQKAWLLPAMRIATKGVGLASKSKLQGMVNG